MWKLFGDNSPEHTSKRDRVPPGQKVTESWPVLHAGTVPRYSEGEWELRMFGLVREERVLSWEQFLLLPRVRVKTDVHCVTGWTKLDNLWEGVTFNTLQNHVDVLPAARFVMVHGEHGYAANLPLEVLRDHEVVFALKHNGRELTPEHGYPVRLVVPKLYFWKSVKWVRGLEFLKEDRRGFWERRGYHNEGDVWKEQRYSAQEDG